MPFRNFIGKIRGKIKNRRKQQVGTPIYAEYNDGFHGLFRPEKMIRIDRKDFDKIDFSKRPGEYLVQYKNGKQILFELNNPKRHLVNADPSYQIAFETNKVNLKQFKIAIADPSVEIIGFWEARKVDYKYKEKNSARK